VLLRAARARQRQRRREPAQTGEVRHEG
jgi:hypothetical protein